MSTIGVKNIQYPDGVNALTVDSSGTITFNKGVTINDSSTLIGELVIGQPVDSGSIDVTANEFGRLTVNHPGGVSNEWPVSAIRIDDWMNEGHYAALKLKNRYHRDIGIGFTIGYSTSNASPDSDGTYSNFNMYVDGGDPNGRNTALVHDTRKARAEYVIDASTQRGRLNTDVPSSQLGVRSITVSPEGDAQIRASAIYGQQDHPHIMHFNCTQIGASYPSSSSSTTANCGYTVDTNGDVGACTQGTSAAHSWWNAKRYCERSGGRLCTRTEMKARAAAGTGCSHDSRSVWTSTPDGTTGKFWAVNGDWLDNARESSHYPYDTSRTGYDINEVGHRCCGQNDWS